MAVRSPGARSASTALGGLLAAWLSTGALVLEAQETPAVPESSTFIELDRGLLSGWRYSHAGVAEQPVYGFGNLSFRPEFEELLAGHPPALEAASRARPWNTVRFLGSAGVVVGLGLVLLDAIDDAGDVESGRLPEGGSGNSGFAVAAGSLVVMVLGEVMARGHLREGVRLYNELASTGEGRPPTSPIPDLRLGLGPQGSVRVGVAWTPRR